MSLDSGWFAVPTAERPKELTRCLDSFFSANFNEPRKWRVLISDDSKSPSVSERVRAAVLSIKSPSFQTYYVGRSARKRLAQKLASNTGVPRRIVDFALLGEERQGPSYGANQNTVQLLTKGGLAVIVDDDVVLRPARYRDIGNSESEIERGPGDHPERTWFFDDEVAAASAVLPTRDNAVTLLSNAIERNALPQRQIAVAVLGLYGDSGMRSSAHYLAATNADTKALLLGEPDALNRALNSRFVVRHAPTDAVRPAKGFLTAAFALNNALPLLPFIPNGRGSDAIFGRSVGLSYPLYDICYVSAAILHAPPGKRQYEGNAGTVTLSSAIYACLDYFVSKNDATLSDLSCASLGEFLVEMTSNGDGYFEEFITQALFRQLNGIADHLLEILYTYRPSLEYSRHIIAAVSDIERSLLNPRFLVPTDVFGDDVFTKKQGLKMIINNWGKTCMSWKHLERATLDLDVGEFQI